jgi:hypothetical protein
VTTNLHFAVVSSMIRLMWRRSIHGPARPWADRHKNHPEKINACLASGFGATSPLLACQIDIVGL